MSVLTPINTTMHEYVAFPRYLIHFSFEKREFVTLMRPLLQITMFVRLYSGCLGSYSLCYSALKMEKHCNKELANKCERGAILLPLKHLSSNSIISNLFYCLLYRAIFDRSAERSEAAY